MNIFLSAQSLHLVVCDVRSWRLPGHFSTCGSHSIASNRIWTRSFSYTVVLWSGSHQPGSLSQSRCTLISGFHEPAKGSNANSASGVCQQPALELSHTCRTRPSSSTSLELWAARLRSVAALYHQRSHGVHRDGQNTSQRETAAGVLHDEEEPSSQ